MLESVLLSIGFAFFIVALCLHHLMVYRVNERLALGEKLPHSLSIGQRNKLRTLYKSLYPRSIIYELTFTCAFTMILLSAVFHVFAFGASRRANYLDFDRLEMPMVGVPAKDMTDALRNAVLFYEYDGQKK